MRLAERDDAMEALLVDRPDEPLGIGVETGGRLVKHARYYWLFLAESHLTRRVFGAMLPRIWALPVSAG